jgi:hypothetical protein
MHKRCLRLTVCSQMEPTLAGRPRIMTQSIGSHAGPLVRVAHISKSEPRASFLLWRLLHRLFLLSCIGSALLLRRLLLRLSRGGVGAGVDVHSHGVGVQLRSDLPKWRSRGACLSAGHKSRFCHLSAAFFSPARAARARSGRSRSLRAAGRVCSATLSVGRREGAVRQWRARGVSP